MNSLRTKKKLKTRMLWWLPLVFLCLSVLFFSYTATQFWFAAETEPENEWEPNYLVDWDYIVVTWVANTVEYLTSLYLYVTDPKSETSVNLKYDPELNALLINSSINANAMGIWYNAFWEWVVWSVFIWGSWNKVTMRGQEVLDEYWDYTWTRNGKNDSAVAIWWISNYPSSAWSVIVWWKNNTVAFSDSTMIWWVDSSLNGHHSVALWSRKSSLNVQDWNSIDMWYNNHWDKFTYLIWSWITTHWWSHWSAAVWSVFAYSPGNSGFSLHGWNLWWQAWFYVNVKNGFWLNTSTPRLTFDFRSAWPLRVIPALWVQNNTMQFSEWSADWITCPDEVIVEKFRWTVAYVQNDWIWAFCWCNGKVWMPMSSDANEQALCAESKADARVCEGTFDDSTVIFHEETKGKPRWDEDSNGWRWEWINLNWTYMWVPSLYSWDVRECSYTCAVGYHPNHKSARWWFTGNCIACSPIENWEYITPGTGINDCEFACNSWYKYDKWAETETGRCTPCNIWEWTEGRNQAMLCNKCEVPVWISADSRILNRWLVFTWWVMWDWTTWTWEPYFRKFTTFSPVGEYGCDFECASWYMYRFSKTSENACVECGIWTYSPWWKYAWEEWGECAACTNREEADIAFSYKDVNGNTHNYTIEAKDVSWYTTKWTNWPESCEWTCNPIIWLVKDWSSCKCPTGSHLELIVWEPKCVSNRGDLACTGVLWWFAIKWSPIATWVSAGTLEWNNWVARSLSWTYVNKSPESLGACEWTCPEDYEWDGANNCKLPTIGQCGTKNWKLVDSLTAADLCSAGSSAGFTSLSDEIEINYYFNNAFQFYPSSSILTNSAKYLAIWTCKWFGWKPEYSANCFAYVKWEAKRAECPDETEWRDASGKAQAKCIYDTPNNCKDGLNCPPIVNKQDIDKVIRDSSIDLDNVLPHWLQWNCPGTFSWNPTACHSCDSGYSWWVRWWGCTKDVITTNCKENSSNKLPLNPESANFWPKSYTNTFNKNADGGQGAYIPWVVYYKRLADWADPTNICEWACQAGTHFCSNSTRCETNSECWHLELDGSGNLVSNYRDYLCDKGYPSSIYTGSDGKHKWSCRDRSSNRCEDVSCNANSYSCYGEPPAHTVNVGPATWLYASASYNLYPTRSQAQWIPCSLVCASGYKYVNGHCEKIDPPLCWEPNWDMWNWRFSPQYCKDMYTVGSANYNTCMSESYNYCDRWTLGSFNILNFDGVSWTCTNSEDGWEDSVPCRAKCRGWTDNVDPESLYLGSSNVNTDSIFVRNSKTLTFTWWDTSWLSVSRTYIWWLSGYWQMRFTGTVNTGAERSTTITFTSNDEFYCSTWKLTIVQCAYGYESKHLDGGGYICVPKDTYSCSDEWKPEHSERVWQRYWFLSTPPANQLYDTREEAEGKDCSLICEEGYTYLRSPDRCVKCAVWKVNADKTWCEVIVDCPEWYQYNPDTGICDVVGNCLDGSNKTLTKAPSDWRTPLSYEESRPIWGNLKWSCRKDEEDIRPHACEFTCNAGNLCSSDGGSYCFTPRCDTFTKSSYWDIDIAVKVENATYEYMANIWWWYWYRVPWQYTGAGTLEAFNKRAYNEDGTPKVEGCWYWCTNNYIDVTTDPTTVRCINPNAPATVYACIGSVKGIRDRNIISTDSSVTFTDHNRDWTFVESRPEYWERVAAWEECLYTCKTGAELTHFSVWDLCAQQCDADKDQYMSSRWYCTSCAEGYKPDPNNQENGIIMGCMYKCDPETQIWNETLKACLAKVVYTLECPEGMTELGRTEDNKLICWIKLE